MTYVHVHLCTISLSLPPSLPPSLPLPLPLPLSLLSPTPSLPPSLQYLLEQSDFLVVGVIGKQGVGKSTIMSLLAGTRTGSGK